MKSLLCGVIIVYFGFVQANVYIRHDCYVRSYHRNGSLALCGDNDDCPNQTDTCKYFPNAAFGSCCAGCKFGEPLLGEWCGGLDERKCPLGYMCVTDPNIMDSSVGQCCSRGLHETD